jgi:hypothetical protein
MSNYEANRVRDATRGIVSHGKEDELSCFKNPITGETWASLEEACLCGIIKALERRGMLDVVVGEMNFAEIGITKADFTAWLRGHDTKDTANMALVV